MRSIILLCSALLLSGCSTSSGSGMAYVNGRWFDGRGFVSRTMYVSEGTLRARAPRVTTEVVDLSGKYVLPPLAEAHNHWLEPERVEDYVRAYLADGVFYVMDQANVPPVATRVRGATNRPDSVDYAVALLGFTAPGGHPIQIVKQFANMGMLPAPWADEANIDRNALLIVTNEQQVDERWPLLREAGTDFVKVFLEFSEEYERRKNDPAFLYRRGIDPKLVPHIVRRAHAGGLRVSAHVYSATDFRNALAAKVDFIAHMPGTGSGEESDIDRFLITDEDARLAARQDTTVITTLGWLDDLREENATRADLVASRIIGPNLRKLRDHGVRLIIGSDQFRETPVGELFILSQFGVSNAEVVRMATVDTAQAIFPGRKVGRLSDGYEASFIVLDDNPLDDLTNVRKIKLRVKQGVPLPATGPAPATP